MAGSPATETYNAAGNSDYSRRIVELASLATPDTGIGPHGYRGVSTNPAHQSANNLEAQARLSAVPSPCTPNGGRSCSTDVMDATGKTVDGRKHTASLEHAVKFAAVTTPSARDWKDTSGMSESGVDPDGSTRSRLDQLPRQAQLADSGPTATGGTAATASIGQLDPAYSRWLMGVPPEWDAFACTAMRSVSQRRKRSSGRTSKPKE
jgi:hypothetical protein